MKRRKQGPAKIQRHLFKMMIGALLLYPPSCKNRNSKVKDIKTDDANYIYIIKTKRNLGNLRGLRSDQHPLIIKKCPKEAPTSCQESEVTLALFDKILTFALNHVHRKEGEKERQRLVENGQELVRKKLFKYANAFQENNWSPDTWQGFFAPYGEQVLAALQIKPMDTASHERGTLDISFNQERCDSTIQKEWGEVIAISILCLNRLRQPLRSCSIQWYSHMQEIEFSITTYEEGPTGARDYRKQIHWMKEVQDNIPLEAFVQAANNIMRDACNKDIETPLSFTIYKREGFDPAGFLPGECEITQQIGQGGVDKEISCVWVDSNPHINCNYDLNQFGKYAASRTEFHDLSTSTSGERQHLILKTEGEFSGKTDEDYQAAAAKWITQHCPEFLQTR